MRCIDRAPHSPPDGAPADATPAAPALASAAQGVDDIASPNLSRALRASRAAVALGLCALSACNTPMPPDNRQPPPPAAPRPSVTPAPQFVLPAVTSNDYKLRIARKLVAANPNITYLTPAENPLFAIPILEIEVNADGSVRDIKVTRLPSDDDAQDTVQLAIDAVRRAAPFGDVTHVPRPWKFTQVFLFNEDRRFKPQLLD